MREHHKAIRQQHKKERAMSNRETDQLALLATKFVIYALFGVFIVLGLLLKTYP